ncbi:hypothetical protein ACTGVN_11155, partial [Streptococcus suis]
MAHDSTDSPDTSRTEPALPEAAADVPRATSASPDIDPATAGTEDDDEARLPDLLEENGAVGDEPLASGHEAIERAVRLAPTSPGDHR